MTHNKYEVMAVKYRVEDLAGASIPGSRLFNILKQLEKDGGSIPVISQEFLRSEGLLSLLRYASKECTFDQFLLSAEPEQSERRLVAEAKAKKERAEKELKDAATKARLNEAMDRWIAEKRAFDNDPKNKARAKRIELRKEYGLDYYIEKEDFPKLMSILRKVNGRVRLSEDEVVWLSTDGHEYFTTKLREGYHKNEADFHAGEYKKNQDPWSAVNASSHYRKCRESKTAESILSSIDTAGLKSRKLKSALCTTHGGAKRDLRKFEEALELGSQAHQITPQDFRPCTLLGAVNMEIGQLQLGQSWFDKAVERGHSEEHVDRELRSIFMRLEKPKQEALRNHLLKVDPNRYSWAKRKSGSR